MSEHEIIRDVSARMQDRCNLVGKPMSFAEYLELFLEAPARQCRNAAQYIRDTYDHFGSRTIDLPTGKVRRWLLFDAEFEDGIGQVAGQEEVQESIYRLLNNFVRSGRVNRLILLHGPNGSAKTSIIHAIVQAMEHYATTPEGALYKFRWLFPSEKIARSHIGFGGGDQNLPLTESGSYAHLPGEDLNAVLDCELKDHPLLLIPREEREQLIERLRSDGRLPAEHPLPEYLLRGDLCAKCRAIYDALLTAYGGNCQKVLHHVQVQRLNLSLRYRRGIASVEPQMHVDAAEQQVTASQGLASLPPAVAHLALYEPRGALVDANRGLLEYNDLLKRPIDTFKYLLSTCESGQVTLDRSTLFLDTVLLGSTNEMLLDSFKAYADFASFKGRLELVRVPYLRRVSEEIQIYQSQLPAHSLERHLAPHTLHLAALWAVLTRLKRPDGSSYAGDLPAVLRDLGPVDKAKLYDRAEVPANVSSAVAKELRSIIPDLYRLEGPDYEGRMGASAREVRMLLMNAAQSEERPCVSPLSLFDEIRVLIADKTVFEFLKQEPDGFFQNHEKIPGMLENVYLDTLEDEAAEALGLVTETSYTELLNRYIQHVTHWQRKEKLRDPVTGDFVPPDEDMIKEVEAIIKPEGEDEEAFRSNLIGRIGAYALDADRTGAREGPPDFSKVFPGLFERLKDDFFEQRQAIIQKNYQNFLKYLDGVELDNKTTTTMKNMRDEMINRFGYCDLCAKEAVAFLLKKRFG